MSSRQLTIDRATSVDCDHGALYDTGSSTRTGRRRPFFILHFPFFVDRLPTCVVRVALPRAVSHPEGAAYASLPRQRCRSAGHVGRGRLQRASRARRLPEIRDPPAGGPRRPATHRPAVRRRRCPGAGVRERPANPEPTPQRRDAWRKAGSCRFAYAAASSFANWSRSSISGTCSSTCAVSSTLIASA